MGTVNVEVSLSPGFHAFPLSDIGGQMDRARKILAPLATGESMDALAGIVGALRSSLEDMRRSGVLYCGMGRHLYAEDGRYATSWLTLSVREIGPSRSPQRALEDLVRVFGARAEGPAGQFPGLAKIREVDGRVMAFHENPAVAGAAGLRAVHQIRGYIPSPDGAWIAVLELSTASVGLEAEYSALLADIARGVRFVEDRVPPLCL